MTRKKKQSGVPLPVESFELEKYETERYRRVFTAQREKVDRNERQSLSRVHALDSRSWAQLLMAVVVSCK